MMKKAFISFVMFTTMLLSLSVQVLASQDYDEIETALTKGDFETIKDCLSGEPGADEVIEKIDVVLDLLDQDAYGLYLSVDDFEGDTWIVPKSVGGNLFTQVGGCIIMPYIYMGTGDLRMELGIEEDDWVFFTTVKIKFNDDYIWSYTAKDYDVNRKVEDEGQVQEYIDIPLDYSDLYDMANALDYSDLLANVDPDTKIMVRFIRDKDSTYIEHDILSLNAIHRFQDILAVKDAYDAITEYISIDE